MAAIRINRYRVWGGVAGGAAVAALVIWAVVARAATVPPIPDRAGSGVTKIDDPTAAGAVAPIYHYPIAANPIEAWRTSHPRAMLRGDHLQESCFDCHAPATYCNKCHDYVGALPVQQLLAPATPRPQPEGGAR